MSDNGDHHYNDFWNYLIKNTKDNLVMWAEDPFIFNNIRKFNPDIVIVFDIDQIFANTHFILKCIKTEIKKQIPIVALLDDFFYINTFKNSCISCIDAVMFKVKQEKTKEEYKQTFPNLIIKSLDTMYINTEVFKDLDIEKEYDIFLYGTRHFECKSNPPINSVFEGHLTNMKRRLNVDTLPEKICFYEFRARVMNLIENSNRYKVLCTPDKEKIIEWRPQIRNHDLAREINRAYLSLSTKTGVDKCMMKYIEISACGTGLIGDIPTDYKELFQDNIVDINDDMTDTEILDKISKALEDKKTLIEKSKEFGLKVSSLYGSQTLNNYNHFIKLCNEIITEYCSNKKRILTVNTLDHGIEAGLGNQLFNVFTCLALAKDKDMIPVFRYREHCRKYGKLFSKLFFKNDLDVNSFDKLIERDQTYMSPHSINSSRNTVLQGYFQTHVYFDKHRESLLELLFLDDTDLKQIEDYTLNLKKGRKTVGIHVRRTDYLGLGWDLKMEYYREALTHFDDSCNFVVFSDDTAWCKQNFPNYPVFNSGIDYIDLFVMSKMDAMIMANSTFCWWAVYIGNIQNVIAPYPWFVRLQFNPQIYRDNWKIINVTY